MNHFRIGFLFCFFLLFGFTVKGQDTLQLVKNSKILLVKVTEIGLDEVKYRMWNMEESPVVVVDKHDIKRIVLSNGTVMNFYPDQLSLAPSERLLNKNNAIKFHFFSPLYNSLALAYETASRKGYNVEFKIGFIGVGISENWSNASGLYLKAGPKFWPGKDYYMRGEKRSHPLRGSYIKPEISFSHFKEDITDGFSVKQRVTYDNFALNIVFGKQYILADVITLDWYIGAGYGFQKSNFKENPNNSGQYYDFNPGFEPNAFSHIFLGETFPMTLTSGLTIGMLF
jgi:hypothetical protein